MTEAHSETYTLAPPMAGLAFVVDADRVWAIDVRTPEPQPATRTAFRFFARQYPDVREMDSGPSPYAALRAELEREKAWTDLLHFALSCMDARLTEALRTSAIRLVEDKLRDPHLAERLRRRLLGRPPVPSADLGGALALCIDLDARQLHERLHELDTCQRDLAALWEQWHAVAAGLSPADQRALTDWLLTRDASADLLPAVRTGNRAAAGPWLLRFSAEAQGAFPHAPRLLNQWLTAAQEAQGTLAA